MSQKIHVGDVGTRFDYEIRDEDGELIPLDDVEELFVRYKRPNRTTFDRDLTEHETTASMAFYVFEDEFDAEGSWQHQYRVNMPDGTGWWSERARFRVYPHILESAGS